MIKISEEQAVNMAYATITKDECKSCKQIFNIDITGEYPCHFCGMPTVHDTKGSAK